MYREQDGWLKEILEEGAEVGELQMKNATATKLPVNLLDLVSLKLWSSHRSGSSILCLKLGLVIMEPQEE